MALSITKSELVRPSHLGALWSGMGDAPTVIRRNAVIGPVDRSGRAATRRWVTSAIPGRRRGLRGAVRSQFSTCARLHSFIRPCWRTGAGNLPRFTRSHAVLGDNQPNFAATSVAVISACSTSGSVASAIGVPVLRSLACAQKRTCSRDQSRSLPPGPVRTTGLGKPGDDTSCSISVRSTSTSSRSSAGPTRSLARIHTSPLVMVRPAWCSADDARKTAFAARSQRCATRSLLRQNGERPTRWRRR